MPRHRTTRRQAQAFLVSPWMSQHPTSHQESPWYQVVEVPGLVVQQQADPQSSQQQEQQQEQQEQPHVQATPAEHPAKRPHTASADGWVTTRRHRALQQAPPDIDTPASCSPPPAANGVQHGAVEAATTPVPANSSCSTEAPSQATSRSANGANATHSSSWGLTPPAPPPQAQHSSISGTARLVLLPSGDFTGHLVEAASRRCWGLVGRQVLAQNNCYRDTDWSLLKLTLQSYTGATSAAAAAAAGSSVCSPPGGDADQGAGCGTSIAEEAPDRLDVTHCTTATTAEQQQHQGGKEEDEDAMATEGLQSSTAVTSDTTGTAMPSSTSTSTPSSGAPPDTSAADQQQQQQQQQLDQQASPSSSDGGGPLAHPGDEGDVMQLEAWVQRTGGDLFKLLPADMSDEDTAAVVLADNLGLEPACPQVEFVGQQLLAGGAVGAGLGRAYPGLSTQQWRECVVNVGPMVIQQMPDSCHA